MSSSNNNRQTTDFDFNEFNAITKSANAGLKVFLAMQLMDDAWNTYRRYNNEFAKNEAESIVTQLQAFRTKLKAQAEARKRGGPSQE